MVWLHNISAWKYAKSRFPRIRIIGVRIRIGVNMMGQLLLSMVSKSVAFYFLYFSFILPVNKAAFIHVLLKVGHWDE